MVYVISVFFFFRPYVWISALWLCYSFDKNTSLAFIVCHRPQQEYLQCNILPLDKPVARIMQILCIPELVIAFQVEKYQDIQRLSEEHFDPNRLNLECVRT